MSRSVKLALLSIIAASHIFLIAHSQEPLRLNVGDPWSEANVLSSLKYVKQYGFLKTSFTDILDVGPLTQESYRYTHYPPLSEIIYGAVHTYLGIDSLGILRLFAIGFSAVAMWFLFCYVRRLYDEDVALIATALWSCNLMWMMYADMIHQAPVMQASAFLGLWGLLRALDDPRLRYWIAAWIGCFACFLTSYDYFFFLPIAVLVTVGLRRGNPFRKVNWGPVLVCASACAAAIVAKSLFVIGAVGWSEFLDDLHFQFLERSTSEFEQHLHAVVPTLTRRATMVFSPLIWGLIAYQVARLLRRHTRRRFFADGVWLALPALAFFRVFSQLAASQMLTMQSALPYYAICSALLLVRLLRAGGPWRRIAVVLLAFVPAWSAFWLLRQKRAFVDEQGFAQVKKYLDEHDKNDWLMCNLMADGPIQAYLDRHYWPAFASEYNPQYRSAALDLMERFAHDEFYVLFFKTPETRMIDKSLWPLAMPRKQWSVTGSHLFWPKKAARLIQEADDQIKRNLHDVDAEVVLSRPQFDLYKVTRPNVVAAMQRDLPETTFVDLGSFTSQRYMILGWSGQRWDKSRMLAGAAVSGHAICPVSGKVLCRTVLTKRGLISRGDDPVAQGELMLNGTNACDAELIIRLMKPTLITIDVNATRVTPRLSGTTYKASLQRGMLVEGANVITIGFRAAETMFDALVRDVPPVVVNIELRQSCNL